MKDENTPKENAAFYAGSCVGGVIGFIGGIFVGYLMGSVDSGRTISKAELQDLDNDGKKEIVVYSKGNEQRPTMLVQQPDGTYMRIEDVNSERLKKISTEVEKVRMMQNQELSDWYKNVKPEAGTE